MYLKGLSYLNLSSKFLLSPNYRGSGNPIDQLLSQEEGQRLHTATPAGEVWYYKAPMND